MRVRFVNCEADALVKHNLISGGNMVKIMSKNTNFHLFLDNSMSTFGRAMAGCGEAF